MNLLKPIPWRIVMTIRRPASLCLFNLYVSFLPFRMRGSTLLGPFALDLAFLRIPPILSIEVITIVSESEKHEMRAV